MSIDWKRYRETFPERYMKESAFDASVAEIATLYRDHFGEILALDIGGGILGTESLQKEGVSTWLADPFVDCPDWMKGNFGNILDVQGQFHLIIARGSFNYMGPEEISRIPSRLREDGTFLFNTFGSVRNQERRYKSFLGEGTERVVVEGNQVTHSLVPDHGIEVVHSFFVYSKKEIELLLPGVVFREVGKNTLHGYVTK